MRFTLLAWLLLTSAASAQLDTMGAGEPVTMERLRNRFGGQWHTSGDIYGIDTTGLQGVFRSIPDQHGSLAAWLTADSTARILSSHGIYTSKESILTISATIRMLTSMVSESLTTWVAQTIRGNETKRRKVIYKEIDGVRCWVTMTRDRPSKAYKVIGSISVYLILPN